MQTNSLQILASVCKYSSSLKANSAPSFTPPFSFSLAALKCTACVRLQLSSSQKLTHQLRFQTNFIPLSLCSSVLIPPLFLSSQISSFLIEISGASSGEDVEVAKVCCVIGVSHRHTHAEIVRVCVCVLYKPLKTISNNPVSFTHTLTLPLTHTQGQLCLSCCSFMNARVYVCCGFSVLPAHSAAQVTHAALSY